MELCHRKGPFLLVTEGKLTGVINAIGDLNYIFIDFTCVCVRVCV